MYGQMQSLLVKFALTIGECYAGSNRTGPTGSLAGSTHIQEAEPIRLLTSVPPNRWGPPHLIEFKWNRGGRLGY
ncbi:hypothetical protein KFK09_007900 [Dendrobium nobile]|uniref:Uncharacterized protein n=1 Tax=Dendrobium nobile TaxID=94219 RepID=A0A8T3BT45_DENNO|nr:hypothetical protein KFK09_007900 [Dendrobium nobile]